MTRRNTNNDENKTYRNELNRPRNDNIQRRNTMIIIAVVVVVIINMIMKTQARNTRYLNGNEDTKRKERKE